MNFFVCLKQILQQYPIGNYIKQIIALLIISSLISFNFWYKLFSSK